MKNSTKVFSIILALLTLYVLTLIIPSAFVISSFYNDKNRTVKESIAEFNGQIFNPEVYKSSKTIESFINYLNNNKETIVSIFPPGSTYSYITEGNLITNLDSASHYLESIKPISLEYVYFIQPANSNSDDYLFEIFIKLRNLPNNKLCPCETKHLLASNSDFYKPNSDISERFKSLIKVERVSEQLDYVIETIPDTY